MRRYIKRGINWALAPLGLQMARTGSEGVPRGMYLGALADLHACYLAHVFPELPRTPGREPLLAALGGGVAKAIHLLAYLHRSLAVPGDVCELGVARGATSALLANEIRDRERDLWLFDSFAGLSAPTARDALIDDVLDLGSMAAYAGTMDFPQEAVKASLAAVGFPASRARIVPGFVEQTLSREPLPAAVCFAYVDMDFYEPIAAALRFLATRLSPGGHVVVDDYGYFSAGAQAAVDEFVAAQGNAFERLDLGQDAGTIAVLARRA